MSLGFLEFFLFSVAIFRDAVLPLGLFFHDWLSFLYLESIGNSQKPVLPV